MTPDLARTLDTSSRLSRACAAVGAAAFAFAALALAAHHPLSPLLTIALFAVWTCASFAVPWLPLFVLPALLPVIDLAPWTGWLVVEEFDLLVLGAIVGGYARLAASPEPTDAQSRASFSLTGTMWVGLFLISQAIALYRGIADAGGLAFDLAQGYDGPLNSLRIAKSFVLAIAIYPVVRGQWRSHRETAQRALATGFVAGLVAVSFAVVWERLAFTELLNFSSDYRTTALFWEMHVGGAALDGFLALTLPFAVWCLYRDRSLAVRGACLAAAALGAYAALTTFSRGVYLSTVVSLGLLYWLVQRQRPAAGQRVGRGLLGVTVVAAGVSALGTYYVFRAGGYRSLAAMVVVAMLAIVVVNIARSIGFAPAVAAAVVGAVVAAFGWIVSGFLPKGPYVFFAAMAGVAGWATFLAWRTGRRAAGLAAVAGYVASAVAAVAVAHHWGGTAALRDAAVAAAILVAIGLAASVHRIPGWPDDPHEWKQAAIATLLSAGVVAVFAGGAYMGGRFATADRDLDDRFHHWRIGLQLLKTPGDWVLGRGMGRFPAAYLFGSTDGVIPGGYSIGGSGDNRMLVLSSPSYSISFGDAFRVSQRVAPLADVYTVRATVRTRHPAHLHFEICEKHLLYSGQCGIASGAVEPDGDRWQEVVLPLDGTKLSRGRWFAPNLASFSITLETSGRAVEVDRVSLVGSDHVEILANGDFSGGMTRWFFTSDRYHLPWHFKNLFGNILFEQGIVGLTAFLILLSVAGWRLVLGEARDHPLAPALAAAILGFLVVGMFDSLLDAPRVAFAFYLLLLTGLALRRPKFPA